MPALLQLMRPYQYTKNLFIFVPLFFAFEFTNPALLGPAALAFVAFCLMASAVYIFNDWRDIDEDRRHPVKSRRALPAGRVAPRTALLTALVLAVAGGVLMGLVSLPALLVTLAYVGMNLAYSLGLKQISIIDISLIATGFVLRLLVGAVVTGVALSVWIIVMTFLLALFLSLAKRRDDVLVTPAANPRYNLKFLDAAMVMSASVVVLAYILWAISPEVAQRLGSDHVYLTSAFVVLGVLRYLQIAMVDEQSGDPAWVLLRDRFVQLVLAGWVAVFSWILYFA